MNRGPPTGRAGSTPLARAFRLLEIVVEADLPLAVAELAGRSGIPKPTVHRLVNHLIAEGLLRSDTAHRGLVPGPRFAGLFCKAHAASWAGGPIRALMEALVAEVRETCNLGVLDRDAVLYIERVECDWPIRIQLSAGSRVPLHASAIGKLLMAHLPTAARRQLLASIPLTALTANTLTDADALERAFTEIRRRGYALNNAENTDGVIGLAVPVKSPDERVVAGLSVHAPTSRLDLDGARALLPRFQAAAAAMGAQLGEAA
jgi:DNA-binding IclR family transcriptional regulator